jgi:hypothetical protein
MQGAGMGEGANHPSSSGQFEGSLSQFIRKTIFRIQHLQTALGAGHTQNATLNRIWTPLLAAFPNNLAVKRRSKGRLAQGLKRLAIKPPKQKSPGPLPSIGR